MEPCRPLDAKFSLVIGPEQSLVPLPNHLQTGSENDSQLSFWDQEGPLVEKYKEAKAYRSSMR